MKRKLMSLFVSAATVGIACLVALPAWSAETYGPGQNAQQRRIEKGAKSGKITPGEHRRLQREQHRIHRFAKYSRADGRVDRYERRRLANMKHRADRHIYQAKHNRKRCHSCYYVPAPRHHSHHPCRHRPAGSFRGAVMQPGLSMAWNIGLH